MLIEIPRSLRRQLLTYRRRVWWVKLSEACAGALIGVLVGFLLIFVADRFLDTPWLIRGAILGGAALGCAAIPMAFRRWVWRRRRLDQLARLLARTDPRVGEPLLSVIELAGSPSEQARSRALVAAAITQVANAIGSQDLTRSVPASRHRRRTAVAMVLAGCVAVLLLVTRPASVNAWTRFLTPWRDVPRYTFVSMQELPASIVVPHGEAFDLELALSSNSVWRPDHAELRVADHGVVTSAQQQGRYAFRLPGQIAATELGLRVGDFVDRIAVQPVLRPELTSLQVEVELPEYLGRNQRVRQQIRGSSMTAVAGSRLKIQAQASRELAAASINDQPRAIDGVTFGSDPVLLEDRVTFQLQWRDQYDLAGTEDFTLSVEAVQDQPPTVRCEGLPNRQLLLENDVVTFRVIAVDDFGIKRVGFEWQGLETDQTSEPTEAADRGERILAAGGPDVAQLELSGAFSAAELGIDPQPISIRLFVEDFLPGRPRVYTSESVLQVVTADRHAAWVTDQLQRWHRMSMDVRDRELQLYERNKELRQLSEEQLDRPEVRHELLRQTSQERAGAKQLNELVRGGEELLREAMRNPETSADSIAAMAGMMQSLKEIADDRMPSVADLLQQASQARSPTAPSADDIPTSDTSEDAKSPVGQNHLQAEGPAAELVPQEASDPSPPAVADIESTHRKLDPMTEGQPDSPPEAASPSLSMPTTMLAGTGPEGELSPDAGSRPIDEAVREQAALIAEFDQVAEELAAVMDRLEGSTFVKRLKAAARAQQQIAASLNSIAESTFGVSANQQRPEQATLRQLAGRASAETEKLTALSNDMLAFYGRNLSLPYRSVLQQIRDEDLLIGLRELAHKIERQGGLAIALAEYWSDTFDRWAEDLVPTAKADTSPEESPPSGSLPPAILLEVLRLLDAEVKLREQTRVAEQARMAVSPQEHSDASKRLAEQQQTLRVRVDVVVEQLAELAEEEIDFAGEAALLSTVGKLMGETTRILTVGETGPPAIAAETEAIELMLQSNRFNPSGGGNGGGGSSPGGGGGGTTDAEALAIVGAGRTAEKVESESAVTHSSGGPGVDLPDEFRSGLNEYFNRVEAWRGR